MASLHALNLLGSALWAASFVAAGHFFGSMLGLTVGDLTENLALFMLADGVVAFIGVRIAHLRQERIVKRASTNCAWA